jgi:hypothetical protein
MSYLLCFLFNTIRKRGQNRICLKMRVVGGEQAGGRNGPNNIYTYE